MKRLIVLDAGPRGLVTNPRGTPLSSACSDWMQSQLGSGTVFVVPEIADYEVRHELVRIGRRLGLRRLDELPSVPGIEYLPLTTQVMHEAASLWALARRQGRPTADPHALDCDAVLGAQARILRESGDDVIVATANVRHLALFVEAAEWQATAIT